MLDARRARHQRPRGGRAGVHRALPRRGRELRGVDRTWTAPRSTSTRRTDVNGRGAGNVAAAAAAVGCRRDLPVHRLRLRRLQGGAATSSPTRSARCRPTGCRSSPASARPRPPTSATASCARRGCSASTARNFVDTMLGLAQDREEVSWCATRSAARPTPATWPTGLVRLLDGEDYGVHHMAGGGRCSWYDFAVEIFSQAGLELPRAVDDQRHARPPRPAPGLLGARLRARAPDRCCRTGTRAWRDYLAERAEVSA